MAAKCHAMTRNVNTINMAGVLAKLRSEARVRSVEVNPASSDISTAHMAHDGISAESQVQHFQVLWSFQ
jgi:hypothetical protein